MESKFSAETRYCLVSEVIYKPDIGKTISDRFKEDGYKPTQRKLKRWTMWLASLFAPETKYILKQWQKEIEIDCSKEGEQPLLSEFNFAERSIFLMCNDIINNYEWKDNINE
mmetsp:Transcript_16291/g.18064  ORF Transcript_16291/g.18064 Transcript_16291/m.18064 type:complete len:112 (-) Transcript_16291:4-339(-)